MDAPVEENFELLSIDDRLTHKSWKARVSGYTALIKTFKQTVSESDPIFKNYVNNPVGTIKEWVRDANAVSQEKGVEAVTFFIEFGGKQSAKTRPDVMPSIVEKCLGSARSQTKMKAIEVCLLFVEVEEDQGEGVINDLSPGLDVKQPKVVAGVVTAFREIVRQFGAKSLAIKSILRLLPKIFSHADKTVRSEGTLLALALNSYLGPALTPHLSELKPVQVKELTEAFEEADRKGEGLGNVKATRFTRSQQRDRQIKEAQGTLEGKAGNDEVEESESAPDPFDFVEAVEILSVLPEDFYTNLSSSNWKARKELALEPLLSLVKVPRIKSGNYSELIVALAGRMGDANVVCVTLAANCVEALALGLRDEFGQYRDVITGPVLARTKEKKASVLDALGSALDAVYLSVSIGDITPEVVTYSKDKNPSVKAETIKWYIRCLKLTLSPPPKADLQPITEVLLKALGDSGEPVRVAAAEGLGTLMKVFGGERAFGGQMEGLDDLRKAKVMEAFENAVVKVKAGAASSRAVAVEAPVPMKTKPKPKAPPAVVKERPPMTFDDVESEPTPPPKAAPRMAPVSRPPIKGPPVLSTTSAPPAKKIAPPPAASASSSKSAPSKPSEPLKYKFNQEDAEFQAEGILPADVFAGLSDGNWKVRLGAMESLNSWLSGGEMENVESELIIRYLSKKPGWKESNFQVSAKMFGIFQLLADESPLFSKASIAIATPGLSDKLGDIKLKKPAGDAMTSFAEKSSLQFVLSQAYEPMTKQKAPKAQADSMVWVDQAIRDFGIGGLAVREMIDFLKVGLKSTNAAVRTSATKTLVTVKLFVGADISSFLQDLNPALLTTIESEFTKVANESPPEATRTAADSVVVASSGSKAAGGKGTEDALDDLYPRVDLDKLVSSTVINSINDANWKIRKESLETVQSILEANKRLKPSNLSDLTTALKLRLADSNKIVQVLALDVVARIATAMGKAFDKHGRIFSGPVAGVLADQKANIRASGIVTLSAIADASGLDSLLSTFEKPLDSQNPLLRKELLTWLDTRLADEDVVATLDLTHITVAVLSCLEDRNADVRKVATGLLPPIISRAGFAYVMDQTSKLKPASRSTVVPLIENARGSNSISSQPVARALPPSKATSAATKSLRTNAPPSAIREETPVSRTSSIRPATSALQRKVPAPSSSRASPIPTVSTPTLKEPPFKTSDLQPKSMRSSKETGALRWVVEQLPRPDQVEALFQQMTPVTSSELLLQLFSTDHNSERDFAAGLTVLIDSAKDLNSASNYDITSDEMRARLLANLDIIFKYITLRIGLPSTTITVKCLDLIEALLTVSDADGYKLSDYETTPLLISLIGKVGDGKETIRQRVRGIFRSLCDVYPSSRIFSTIMEYGLISKNARTRTESADELGSLFKRHGTATFSLPKALPALAKLIGDRDAAVRTAALTAIGSAYTIVGAEVVYKYIGSIPDRDRTMLEERLKRTAGGAPSSPAPSNNPLRSATPSRGDSILHPSSPSGTPRPLSMIGSKVPAKGIPRMGLVKAPTFSSQIDGNESKLSPPSRVPAMRGIPRPSSTIGLPPRTISSTRPSELVSPIQRSTSTSITGLIQSIVVEDVSSSTEALKQVQQVIGTRPESLLRNADELIEALVRKMSVAFSGLDSETSLPLLRLCKHIMQTLSHFFDNKSLGQSVSSDALTILLAELAGRLLDTAENQASEAIASLSKVLNMVLIRIFHHANQTACFTALFAVLQDATIDLRELKGNELTDRAKYAELVMKCLWKVSKTVKESLISDSLSASRLLRDINGFLVAIPPGEWRRRVSDSVPLADMPLRTVKTILQQIVSVYADDVYDELDEVDKATTSFVYQYLLRLVANNAANRPTPPTGSPARSGASRTSSTASAIDQVETVSASPRVLNGDASRGEPSPESEGRGDIEMNKQLRVIFDIIGDPGRSREGISALYQFQKANPEAAARISTWMSTTGNYFQTYLKRSLDTLATADQEKNGFESTPTNAPVPPRVSSLPRAPSVVTTPVKESSSSTSTSRNSLGAPITGTTSPGAKLLELQSMFGFSSTESGRM